MAPIAASLARSESKAKFLKRIGLDEGNKIHRHLYSKMKAEAVEGWTRMTSTRDALVPGLANDPTVNPPYTYAQINESAMRSEVNRIYEQACPETKIMYNLANDTNTSPDENWIIRWFLWHVFRYRDDRNGVVNRVRAHHSADTPTYTKQVMPSPKLTSAPASVHKQLSISSPTLYHASCAMNQSRYWDPIREQFRDR